MATTTLNISLPEALKEHVQKRVAEGAFSNASDFMRALIRLDREAAGRLAALRRDIAVGIDQLDRGEGLEGERILADLLDERRQRQEYASPRHCSRGTAGSSGHP